MQIVKIEVLKKYKGLTVYQVADALELEYKNVCISDLVVLRKLINSIRRIENADIYKMEIQKHLDTHPFFILTQTHYRKYLLFLELVAGFKYHGKNEISNN